MPSSSKSPLRLSDSVSSRVSRALRKAASAKLSGFTLAELIVVIAILAVLATVGFLALSGYSSDARDARAKANVRSVASAISSESALTGNSPRWYVAHDPDYALSGAYLYVDGTPVALTGGNAGEAPSDSNYTAGQPRWDRLKLDAENFRTSGISAGSRLAGAFSGFLPGTLRTAFLPSASAAFDKTALSAGAADVPSVSAAGKVRTVPFFQVAGILPETGGAAVFGNFPEPSEADLAASESNGKPVAAGLVRNPDAGASEALTDSSSVSAPPASCGATPHGGTKAFWTAESVPHGQSCPAGAEFSCDNGSWTHASADKADYPSEVECVVWTPADCSAATVDGYSLAATDHAGSVTGTKPDPSFPNGTGTLSQDFLCSNGTFAQDGTETGTVVSCDGGYESDGTACVPKSCSLPWGGTIAHGAQATAYQSPTATHPATCVSQARTCNLWVLDGTYAHASCAACGTANGTSTAIYPSSNLCSAGTASGTDLTGTDGTFNWSCVGSEVAATVNCSATKAILPSCKAILDAGASIGNNTYSIDPDGAGAITPFDVYCDMSTDGGGWTLMYSIRNETTNPYVACSNFSNAYCNNTDKTRHMPYSNLLIKWKDCPSAYGKVTAAQFQNDSLAGSACYNTADQLGLFTGQIWGTGIKVWGDCGGGCGGQAVLGSANWNPGKSMVSDNLFIINNTWLLADNAWWCGRSHPYCPTGYGAVFLR